jgi:hypothetical protein
MNNTTLRESNLVFDFIGYEKAERFDESGLNASGLKAVDFIAETADCQYFIEVKDYQNPNAPMANRQSDLLMLKKAMAEEKNVFILEMGEKIKDSLLRRYAEGAVFAKKVKYLLLINLDKLSARELGQLKVRINGHVPKGLSSTRFTAFSEISFDVVTVNQLEQYSISCSAVQA